MNTRRLLPFFLLPLALFAAAPDPRLQEWLKRYPDADANRDGILTIEEAQAYAKVIRGGKKGKAAEVPAFYGFKTEAELDQAGAILADVDMLALVSPDDPPVFMFTSHPEGAPANRGHYLHHPDHVRLVKKACDAAGVWAEAWFALAEPRLEGSYLPVLRAFLLKRLQAKP